MGDADWRKRRTTPAGQQGQHGDKDAQSNWRDPPRPAEKPAEEPNLDKARRQDVLSEACISTGATDTALPSLVRKVTPRSSTETSR
jgi:hypothetical protein